MPRMQVYLPDDLYQQLKARKLPASELLQGAVRAEIRRQDLLAHGRVHAEELKAEVGEPTSAEQERADVIARRLVRRPFPGTGR
jgi:hypothetical protein